MYALSPAIPYIERAQRRLIKLIANVHFQLRLERGRSTELRSICHKFESRSVATPASARESRTINTLWQATSNPQRKRKTNPKRKRGRITGSYDLSLASRKCGLQIRAWILPSVTQIAACSIRRSGTERCHVQPAVFPDFGQTAFAGMWWPTTGLNGDLFIANRPGSFRFNLTRNVNEASRRHTVPATCPRLRCGLPMAVPLTNFMSVSDNSP